MWRSEHSSASRAKSKGERLSHLILFDLTDYSRSTTQATQVKTMVARTTQATKTMVARTTQATQVEDNGSSYYAASRRQW